MECFFVSSYIKLNPDGVKAGGIMAKNVMTYEGLQELEKELEHLKVNRRREIAAKIKEAREQGDLSENAEVFLEEDAEKGTVNLGSTFTLLDMEYDEEVVYKLVGATEANSLEGKISNESPVGSALKGAKEGDIVEVDTPAGTLKYKVIKIHK